MKAAYTVLGYPTTFSQRGGDNVNRGFVVMIDKDFLAPAVEALQGITEVVAVRVIGKEPEPTLTPEQQEQEERDTVIKTGHTEPVQVIISAALGNLLEDVFETVRLVLDTLAEKLEVPHDPTEVILAEVAELRGRQRLERRQRSSMTSSAPIAPATDRRQRLRG